MCSGKSRLSLKIMFTGNEGKPKQVQVETNKAFQTRTRCVPFKRNQFSVGIPRLQYLILTRQTYNTYILLRRSEELSSMRRSSSKMSQDFGYVAWIPTRSCHCCGCRETAPRQSDLRVCRWIRVGSAAWRTVRCWCRSGRSTGQRSWKCDHTACHYCHHLWRCDRYHFAQSLSSRRCYVASPSRTC